MDTAASLDFLFYAVVKRLEIPDASCCLKSTAVAVPLVVSKNQEGLMAEEMDLWRTLCHGIPLNNSKQAVALTDEVLYSHLKKNQTKIQ